MAEAGVMVVAAAMLLAGSEWGFGADDERFVQFRAEGRVAGHGGCNRFGDGYTQDGDKVSIGPLMATRMACAEDVMQREQELFGLLESTRSVDASHLELILKDESGKELAVLVRRDWD